MEARLPSFDSRFNLLAVQSFLKLYGSPARRSETVFISQPELFFGTYWQRFHTPQVLHIQSFLDNLKVQISAVSPISDSNSSIEIQLDKIILKQAKLTSDHTLNSILSDYLVHSSIRTVIATDASQNEEKCGIALFAPILDWSFSLLILDFVPIFAAEVSAIIWLSVN